jgi:hypothetical protein
MKKLSVILVAILIASSLSSCIEVNHCIEGNGVLKTEIRRTGDFTSIENSTSIDVVFQKGEKTSVTIDAEENLIDYIVTETDNNTLVIHTREGYSCLNFNVKPVITVTSPGLAKVYLYGSGNFMADEMAGENAFIKVTGSGSVSISKMVCTKLTMNITGSGNIKINNCQNESSEISITGSGDIDLAGQGNSSNISITGSGEIYSEGWLLISANITITGSGSVFTSVSQSLIAIISGSGNIYLKGNPFVSQTITGSGRIIKY